MKRTTKSLIALLVLVAMCVSFCVPTFAEVTGEHEHAGDVVTGTELKCPGKDVAHTKYNCDYEESEELSVEASCGRDGYTAGVCKTCGYTFAFDVVLKPNDHNYVNNGEAVAPKCEKTDDGYKLVDGYQPVKCSICGDEKNETIVATENVHVWSDPYLQGTDNPCTPEGAVYVKKCTVCETVVEVSKEQYDEHEWVLTGKAQPSVCVNDGWVEFACTHCGETKIVVIESQIEKHTWEEVSAENTTVQPTHNTTGLAVVACTKCDATDEVELATINHEWKKVAAKAATCTEPGNELYYTCECGKLATKSGDVYTIIDEIPVIKANGHTTTTTTVVGNCTTYTVTTTTCSECDYKDESVGTEYVHSYAEEPTSAVEPTCKTYGYFFYGCTICGAEEAVKSVRRDKLDHNFDEENENGTNVHYISKGSCTEDKVFYYTCINVIDGVVCGAASEEKVEEAKDHTWAYNEVTPNCVEGGYKEKWCSVCDTEKTTTYAKYEEAGVNPNYHKGTADGKLSYRVTTPATCTDYGAGLYFCSYCGVSEPEIIKPIEHAWTDVAGTRVEPSCGNAGSVEQYCANKCGVKNQTITIGTANGHAEVLDVIETVPATCTTTEKITYGCPNCKVDGKYAYTVVSGGEAQQAHDYEISGDPILPNCQGQKAGQYWVCSVCQDEIFIEDTDVVYDKMNPAHHFVDGVDGGVKQQVTHDDGTVNEWYIKGTCVIEGKYQYECKFCKELYLVSANDGSGKGHDADKITKDPASIKPAVEKTCHSEGFTEGYKCAFCDYTVKPESTGYAEHDWKNDKEVPATCLDSGTEAGRTCQVAECGKKEGYAPIDALNHSFTNYVPNGDANCTSVGTKTAKCDRCDATDTKDGDAIDADNHSFTNYVSNNDATCLADGTETAKCDRCDATDTKADEDSALDHLWIGANGEQDKVVVPATCTTKGYIIYSCLRCDDKDRNEANDRQYIVSYEDALGHTYTTLKAVEATCVVAGLTEGEWCPVCKEVFTAQTNLGTRKYHVDADGNKINEFCVAGNSDLTGVLCADCNETIAKTHAGSYANKVAPTCTEDGYTVVGCTVCGDLTITDPTPDLGHEYSEYAVEVAPTVGVPGVGYYYCVRCEEKDPDRSNVEIPAVNGIEFLYEIVNANGTNVVANSNTINVIIKTNATTADIYTIALNLKYDTTVLEFVGYEFNNAKFADYLVGAAAGTVNVTAYATNTSNLVNTELNGLEAFAVISFKVLDDAAGKSIEITPADSSNIFKVDEETEAPVEVLGADFGEIAAVKVVKLGKLTAGSAEDLNGADVIELIGATKALDEDGNKVYNAAADIDKDGDVDLVDAGYLKQYIAGLITYEELCAIGTEA